MMRPVPSASRPPRPTGGRSWPGTAAVIAVVTALVVATAVQPAAGDGPGPSRPSGIVVNVEHEHRLDDLADAFDLRLVGPVLASRGLWLVEPTDDELDHKDQEKLAKELAKEDGVRWAELDDGEDDPEDDRFHAWPDGLPQALSDDPTDWREQPDLAYLRLEEVHRRSTGAGVVVAILDTGVDAWHPALRSHLGTGHYDYVDDDEDPTEEGNGRDDDGDGLVDESFGHGTHAAGLVALIAPDAELLVYRVLDADGRGHPLVIAQAIEDAVDAGADVINISFGMATKPDSRVVRDAFKYAQKHDVSVVAAVGNDGRKAKQYPAEEKDVLGVAAMGRGNRELARFSNYGKPAIVAAPGVDVVSTLPGGTFGSWSGTSMATPIVTGQVALVRAGADDWKAKKVVEIVGKSAHKFKSDRKIEKGLIDILESLDD